MRALVTGAAGFVGSALVEALLKKGHSVTGVDSFTPYYDPGRKRDNLVGALADPNFNLIDADLMTLDLVSLLGEIDVVFHQAGQPGVRLSWDHFETYSAGNIITTQRLLAAARHSSLQRFVYASSSSVYGNAKGYPVTEDALPLPHSPYGVTKLAAEHLCSLYAKNFGVPTVSLRYFSVYGPRQRPDMAIQRLFESAAGGAPFTLYGNGQQKRDFTFVDDVVRANIAAATRALEPGEVMNIAGGEPVAMSDVLAVLRGVTGGALDARIGDEQAGDVQATGGDVTKARELLGWTPRVELRNGLQRQFESCQIALSRLVT